MLLCPDASPGRTRAGLLSKSFQCGWRDDRSASLKSNRMKDEESLPGRGRNPGIDFHGEKRRCDHSTNPGPTRMLYRFSRARE